MSQPEPDKSRANLPGFVDRWVKRGILGIGVLVGTVIGAVVGAEIFDAGIVVEEISAPADLIQQGYTPPVIAYQILREMKHVDRVATTSKQRPLVGVSHGQVELSLPALNISISSIVDYFKGKLGLAPQRLRGGIVSSSQSAGPCVYGCYTALLYLDGPEPKHFSVTGPKYDVEKLIADAARKAVETIDPYLLANFYYASRTMEPGGEAEIERLIKLAMDDPWMVTLEGMTLNRRQQWAEAIPHFDRALKLNSRHAPAFNSRCWAKGHLPNQATAAIDDCRIGLGLDPGSFQTMDSLAFALEQNGRLDEAFAAIKCARRISGDNRDVAASYERLREKLPGASVELPTADACKSILRGRT